MAMPLAAPPILAEPAPQAPGQAPAAPRPIVYKRPIEVMSGARVAPLGAVSRSLALAVLILFFLGSNALLSWANELPINPVTDYLLSLVQVWQDLMQSLGFTHVAEALRDALRAVQAWR